MECVMKKKGINKSWWIYFVWFVYIFFSRRNKFENIIHFIFWLLV